MRPRRCIRCLVSTRTFDRKSTLHGGTTGYPFAVNRAPSMHLVHLTEIHNHFFMCVLVTNVQAHSENR
jgi:hypothetical protein